MPASSNKQMVDLLAEVNKLLEHNSAMLNMAKKGEWEKVKEAEAQREGMINHLYQHAVDYPDKQVIQKATTELIEVNEKLKKLAIQARDSARDELAEMSKGKAAISAYEKNRR